MGLMFRHAAALALVGWYLMIPPLPTTSGWFSNSSAPAPISQWKLWASFDSAMLCEAYRGADDSTWLDTVRRLGAEELGVEAERRNPPKSKTSKAANEAVDVEHSFSAGILLKDWRICNRSYQLQEEDFQPYSLCGWTCIDEVYRWCDETSNKRDQVLFMFEEGDTGQDKLKRRVARDFGIKIETGPKVPDPKIRYERPILPLQTADFASWHVRRVLDELAIRGNVPRSNMRWDFGELFSRVKIGNHHRHFAMTAATAIEANKGIVRRSLGIPSLVKFCIEFGHVSART